MSKKIIHVLWISVVLLLAVLLMAGCGSEGPAGPPGPAGEAADTEPAEVTVDTGENVTAEPGETVTLQVSVDAADGSTVTGYAWEQASGVPATLSGEDTDTLTVTLADFAAYKAEMLGWLPEMDRFQVMGINPHALEAAEIGEFHVTVTTDSGEYDASVEVIAHLPYVFSTGINNVPVGLPVLLGGKVQDSYSWELAGPGDSAAALDDASDRNPSFTPDVPGKYTLSESVSGATFDVYGGTWEGTIVGQDDDGLPVSDQECTTCHNGEIASDQFTTWARSGHAHILTSNIDNPNGHWALRCAWCHSVGYDTTVENGGFDEAIEAEGWEVPHGAVGNWADMLANYPGSARLANIQCENCHGPQESDAHTIAAARQNLASDMCAYCHGEPPRHGRYQQWEESKHASMELTLEDGTVEGREDSAAHCGRCHSGQGFLAWIQQEDLSQRIQGAEGDATVEEMAALGMTVDAVQPTTCAVCHDPHDVGTSSGEPNTATVRIDGDTPMLPAGFQAMGVGRGALCMTCHNSRNGERNDQATEVADDRAPHTASQADVLMGQNAYFVTVGERSKHSLIEDTCAACHMETTPPPPELSYNLSGTNHTFEASGEVCAECHGAVTSGGVIQAAEAVMEELKVAIEQAIIAEIVAQTEAGNSVVLVGAGEDEADVVISDGSTVTTIEFTESHGRSAMDITIGETTYEHIRLGSGTQIQGPGVGEEVTLISSEAGQLIAKAGWNYLLLHGDGSHGIHNPTFALDIVDATLAALE